MNIKNKIGKYQLGRTLGEGNFAKVKFAVNVETGQNYAVKILDKEKVLQYKIVNHIKREICTLKLIKHPNVVRLYEVLASKKKIYIVLEFVTGGELFDKIACDGKLEENVARKYFQQLIDAVGYCHSRGVYHRDLKPENVLLDAKGNVKVSDFGLSALPQQCRADGLLHTTCGSPNYVAPEVIADRGYDGATADLWSCGVILFVLLTGWLPFDDRNLAVLYQKIFKSDFKCPNWLSPGARTLIKRILDPNPKTRITIPEILENEWFKLGYSPAKLVEEDTSLDDVNAAFTNAEEHLLTEETGPVLMNAFQLIAMSVSLDLSGFFEEEDAAERKTRFMSMYPAKDIIEKIESTAKGMEFEVQKKNGKLRLVQTNPKSSRNGHLSVATEVFEVTPCVHVVELRKSAGDIALYRELCRKLSSNLSSDNLPSSNLGFKDDNSVWRADEGVACANIGHVVVPSVC
uniref:non-specific serine/threonine protein kinase n=1 Tax=Wollemia nobilis TaxID=56998 RepID=A0A0C9S9R3_9CONI